MEAKESEIRKFHENDGYLQLGSEGRVGGGRRAICLRVLRLWIFDVDELGEVAGADGGA